MCRNLNLTMENMQTLNLIFFPSWLVLRAWQGHILEMWLFACMSKNSESRKRKYEFRGKSALVRHCGHWQWSKQVGGLGDGKQTQAQWKKLSGIKNGSYYTVNYMLTSCLLIIASEHSIIKEKRYLFISTEKWLHLHIFSNTPGLHYSSFSHH